MSRIILKLSGEALAGPKSMGFDENTGLYKDQKELIDNVEMKGADKIVELSISKLKDQEKKDEITIKKYDNLEEESEDSDDDNKSNITFDEKDIKEAYDCMMENENHNENIINNQNNNISPHGLNGF